MDLGGLHIKDWIKWQVALFRPYNKSVIKQPLHGSCGRSCRFPLDFSKSNTHSHVQSVCDCTYRTEGEGEEKLSIQVWWKWFITSGIPLQLISSTVNWKPWTLTLLSTSAHTACSQLLSISIGSMRSHNILTRNQWRKLNLIFYIQALLL